MTMADICLQLRGSIRPTTDAEKNRFYAWIRPMMSLVVQVERFVDDYFPGFVGCALTDADGVRHEFIEKVPVVSTSDLMSSSLYPQAGHIACIIEEEWMDELGRRLVRVTTEKPWSVESVAGKTRFTVLEEQIFTD
jgi:hypothetical protein